MTIERYRFPEGSRPKLLIVDDQPFHVRVLTLALREDHQILTASSGAEALDLALRERPDLVLLDVVMPELDGLEVCKRLQADPQTSHIPIIFVTGQDSASEESAGLAAGGVDFISKPIHPAIVRARVRTHLIIKSQADELRAMAFIDGLTKVANRHRFDDRFDHEWRICQRERSPLGLIMIDVDHFKAYNDRYGHQAGDAALRAVAEGLRGCARRPRDLVARVGGEEFAVLLPDTDLFTVRQIAETLLHAVARADIPHEASSAASIVSISAGIACTIPAPTQSHRDLFVLADRGLYQAKAAGRNRVMAA